jgi:hypothetical protein
MSLPAAPVYKYKCFRTKPYQVTASAIFLNKIGSRTHRLTQNLVGEREVLVVLDQGYKVEENFSGLCPEKKLTERHSGT